MDQTVIQRQLADFYTLRLWRALPGDRAEMRRNALECNGRCAAARNEPTVLSFWGKYLVGLSLEAKTTPEQEATGL
jgi:hypothetical protein